jgi:hypothetical protein
MVFGIIKSMAREGEERGVALSYNVRGESRDLLGNVFFLKTTN